MPASVSWHDTSFEARYFHVAFLVVFAVAVCVWVATFSSATLGGPDAFDYAQMSRQISSGQGLTTLQLFPRQINWFKNHGYDVSSTPPPNLFRYPLIPLASAAVQLAGPDAEHATMIQSGIGFLLCIPLIYLLALRFTSAPLALLIVVVFVAQSMSWISSRDGSTEALAELLILVVVFLTFSPKASGMRAFVLGVACGLAFLSRSQLVFLLPWSMFFFLLVGGVQKRVSLLWFHMAGAAMVLTPWFVRNIIAAGSPIYSFNNTRSLLWFTRPETFDLELDLAAPVNIGDVLQQYGPVIVQHIAGNLWPNILNPLETTSSRFYAFLLAVSVLTFVFLWKRGQKRDRGPFFLFLAGTLLLELLNFCIICLNGVIPRFLMILDPVLVVAGIQSIALFVREGCGERFGRILPLAVFGLAISVGAAFFVVRMSQKLRDESGVADTADRDSYELIGALAHHRGTVASDESHKVALYSTMQSVRLPYDPLQLLEINQGYLPIQYVVFSAALLQAVNNTPVYKDYPGFRESRDFGDLYVFMQTLPNGAELYGLRSQVAMGQGI